METREEDVLLTEIQDTKAVVMREDLREEDILAGMMPVAGIPAIPREEELLAVNLKGVRKMPLAGPFLVPMGVRVMYVPLIPAVTKAKEEDILPVVLRTAVVCREVAHPKEEDLAEEQVAQA